MTDCVVNHRDQWAKSKILCFTAKSVDPFLHRVVVIRHRLGKDSMCRLWRIRWESGMSKWFASCSTLNVMLAEYYYVLIVCTNQLGSGNTYLKMFWRIYRRDTNWGWLTRVESLELKICICRKKVLGPGSLIVFLWVVNLTQVEVGSTWTVQFFAELTRKRISNARVSTILWRWTFASLRDFPNALVREKRKKLVAANKHRSQRILTLYC